MFKVKTASYRQKILGTVNEAYVKNVIDKALENWHKKDLDNEDGNFIELTPEMKNILETSEWVSSKLWKSNPLEKGGRAVYLLKKKTVFTKHWKRPKYFDLAEDPRDAFLKQPKGFENSKEASSGNRSKDV